MFGIWRVFFGPFGVNLGIILLGLFVLVLAVIAKLRARRTVLFEVSLLLFLVGFLYFTLHSRLLQSVFQISLPEKPLVDNNLTFNYASTSLLTFLIFPILLLILLRSNVSLKSLGLKILDIKQTVFYALFGSIFNVSLFLLSQSLFGFRWIQEYTVSGLVLWILFVSVFSVFSQTFFFIGILFNKHLEKENGFFLAIISITAIQLFIHTSLPWIILNIASSVAKIVVTWKTRNIYGAALMGITTQLSDVLIQIM